MTTPRRDDSPSVDAEHPWIGLVSFTESSRGYFHGRDDEITELCRRIQRKRLTVLFGKSGLGKTSILQAGVVPRLRDQGYCPVYLRIDYAAGAPSAAEQIKQAIVKAAEHSGRWTRTGSAEDGESLWAFLHHRDDVLLDLEGQPLLPLLIFDQFEEIFTLAQADEQGRERAAALRADLADLVENRPPAALEALLEQDDTANERYDLARADYRVVISLREDYLAHLEGLKAAMPSITQNRLRLAPMTGTQAQAAVMEPGRRLVNDEVAAAIVRFVAGGAEVAHAEVEPSLLSLICRELNDQRIALGRPGIGADLLAGSHTSILGEFYERSLADQPVGVRNFIEDHLLTDSGYRENVAEERVRSEFAAAGAQPEALALLVNRRLLRIEERLDLRRVELTHDVLCAVVRASRDLRRDREALDASERLVVAQAEGARVAQRALRRARSVAAVCILLAVGAVAASGFAVISSRHAQQAERDAQATRLRAEQLLSYLQNDFSDQLTPLGRTDLVQSLDDRVVTYFNAASPGQRTPEWEHARAVALVAQANMRMTQGHSSEAAAPLGVALGVLESRYAGGHHSETDLVELVNALVTRAWWLRNAQTDWVGAQTVLDRALKLSDEAARAGNGSEATRMSRASIFDEMCFVEQVGRVRAGDIVASCAASRQQYLNLGAMDTSHPLAVNGYLWSSWLLIMELDRQGHTDEALLMADSALKLGRELLAKQPEFTYARSNFSYINWQVGNIYAGRLELSNAEGHFRDAEAAFQKMTQSDSTNSFTSSDLGGVRSSQGRLALEEGNPALAASRLNAAVNAFDSAPHTAFILRNAVRAATALVYANDDRGGQAGLEKSLARRDGFFSEIQHLKSAVPPETMIYLQCDADVMHTELSLTSNDRSRSERIASTGLAALDAFHFSVPHSAAEESCRYQLTFALARAQYESNDMVAAETSLNQAIQAHDAMSSHTSDSARVGAMLSIWLALAQVHQGRAEAARATLAPALKLQRALFKTSKESALQHLELARALYAQALTQAGAPRHALLAEAAALVGQLPAPMRTLHSVQLWEGWIKSAQSSKNDRVSSAFPAVEAHG